MSICCRSYVVRALVPLCALAATAVAAAPSSAAITFAQPVGYTAGSHPFDVAVGDFDNDGIRDLVTANSFAGNVSVLLGKGDGTFGPKRDSFVGGFPNAVAVGDFNRDGDQDLAVPAQAGSPANTAVLLGNGDGTFANRVNYQVGDDPTAVVIADFNRDGDQDLAVANPSGGSPSVSILLGNPNGTFDPKTDWPANENPNGIASGDFNGDGDRDVVVANQGQTHVTLLLGTGTGGFAAPVPYASGANPSGFAVGDLNGDGIQDLVVANSGAGSVSVLIGNGTSVATFDAKVDYATPSTPIALALADLDRDGDLDLAVTQGADDAVATLAGNGDGTFAPAVTHAAGTAPDDVAAADLGGDGVPDLVVSNNTVVGGVSVLRNAPTASVAPSSLTFGSAAAAVPQGTVSGPQPVTIANNGSAPLAVRGFTVTGANPADFFTSNDSCRGLVAAGASCVVQVRFAPRARGARAASLRVLTNAATNPAVQLSGTGGSLPAGPRGATGPRGPRGPRGRGAKVTCKVKKAKRAKRVKVTCRVVLVAKSSAKLRWRLTRRHHVVARGVALARRGRPRLRLIQLSHLRPGRYRLRIAGRRRTMTIVIG